LNCDFVPLLLCAKAGGADFKGYKVTQTDLATSSYKTTLHRITFGFIVAKIVGLRKKLSYSAMCCVSFFSGLFVRNIFAPLDTNEWCLKDSQKKVQFFILRLSSFKHSWNKAAQFSKTISTNFM
jgi:hypothetical protein